MNELDIHRPFTRALTPTADVLIMAAVAVCNLPFARVEAAGAQERRAELKYAGRAPQLCLSSYLASCTAAAAASMCIVHVEKHDLLK